MSPYPAGGSGPASSVPVPWSRAEMPRRVPWSCPGTGFPQQEYLDGEDVSAWSPRAGTFASLRSAVALGIPKTSPRTLGCPCVSTASLGSFCPSHLLLAKILPASLEASLRSPAGCPCPDPWCTHSTAAQPRAGAALAHVPMPRRRVTWGSQGLGSCRGMLDSRTRTAPAHLPRTGTSVGLLPPVSPLPGVPGTHRGDHGYF